MRSLLALVLLAGSLVACATPETRQQAEDLLAKQAGAHNHRQTNQPGRPSNPLTVEQLAAELGCTPKPEIKAPDYHQATCTTTTGDLLLLLDFATQNSQQTWLEQALDYGTTYLVGNRWILGAPPDALKTLQQKLGGTIKEEV